MGAVKRKSQTQTLAGPAAKRTKNSQTKTPAAATPKRNAPIAKKGKGTSKDSKGSRGSRGRAVEASALEWKTVGEEFGGLEVIEGVDVVRDGGTVQFVVVDPRANDRRTTIDEATDEEEEEEETDGEDDSFEGFGDSPVEGGDVGPCEAGSGQDGVEGSETHEEDDKSKPAKDSRDKNKAIKKDKKDKQQDNKSKENSFGALLAVDEETNAQEERDMGAWMGLNLAPEVVSAIAALGFTKPTTIQERAIPEILAGEDVIGKAQTGSGKTLAFGIPLVEKWLEIREQKEQREKKKRQKEQQEGEGGERIPSPMAVVLSPTRELAKQLAEHLKALCKNLPSAPYVCTVTGGLSIQKQQRQLAKADVVIGTPGRLWEVLDGDMALQVAFTKIQFLVVDEADRLFKAGQFKEAEDIIGALDRRDPEAAEADEDDDNNEDLPPRQTLVFSATFDKDLQAKLAGKAKGKGNKAGTEAEKMEYLMKCLKFRRQPKFIDVNPVTHMAEGLREGLIECGAMEKDLYLYTVLALNPGRRTLVFTNSISAVRRLTPLLTNLGLTALPLHSQMMQKARLRSIERFTASRSSVLIATDVAARGLDIDDIDQVLHYHVPRAADTYIHRSGRTARSGRTGLSVMLCSPEEVLPTRRLAAKVHAERNNNNINNNNKNSSSSSKGKVMETLPVSGQVASRLRVRVDLAKKLADAALAKEKAHSEDTWLRGAAEELGVEYDAEEFASSAGGGKGGKGGRGGGRRRKEAEAAGLSKREAGMLRARLREELGRRVNLGVSERYITGGRVDVGALLGGMSSGGGLFLGGEQFGMSL